MAMFVLFAGVRRKRWPEGITSYPIQKMGATTLLTLRPSVMTVIQSIMQGICRLISIDFKRLIKKPEVLCCLYQSQGH